MISAKRVAAVCVGAVLVVVVALAFTSGLYAGVSAIVMVGLGVVLAVPIIALVFRDREQHQSTSEHGERTDAG